MITIVHVRGVAAVVVMLGLTACGAGAGRQSEEVRRFCNIAEEVDDHLNEGIDYGNVSDNDVIDGLEDLTDVAPNQIVDDVDLVRQAYTIAVEEGDQSVFNDPEVQDATGRFADYLDDRCGIST